MEYYIARLGFNRRAFVEDILNIDFNGDLKLCAKEIGITYSYLKELIYDSTKSAGKEALTKIHLYAQIARKPNPNKYIFIQE